MYSTGSIQKKTNKSKWNQATNRVVKNVLKINHIIYSQIYFSYFQMIQTKSKWGLVERF